MCNDVGYAFTSYMYKEIATAHKSIHVDHGKNLVSMFFFQFSSFIIVLLVILIIKLITRRSKSPKSKGTLTDIARRSEKRRYLLINSEYDYVVSF